MAGRIIFRGPRQSGQCFVPRPSFVTVFALAVRAAPPAVLDVVANEEVPFLVREAINEKGWGDIIVFMKPLAETNAYLRDQEQRRRLLVKNALDSCAFEGARGLTDQAVSPPLPRRRSNAARKKTVKGS